MPLPRGVEELCGSLGQCYLRKCFMHFILQQKSEKMNNRITVTLCDILKSLATCLTAQKVQEMSTAERDNFFRQLVFLLQYMLHKHCIV